jgi:hypothetical protein
MMLTSMYAFAAAVPGNYYCCHHFLRQIIHYLLIIDRGGLANFSMCSSLR